MNARLDEKWHDYDGIVRVILKRSPWQLLFNLHGISLSRASVKTEFDRRQMDGGFTYDDAVSLFEIGTECTLQLEYSHTSMPSPVLPALITQRQTAATGLRLEFAFSQKSDDLDILLEEIQSQVQVERMQSK